MRGGCHWQLNASHPIAIHLEIMIIVVCVSLALPISRALQDTSSLRIRCIPKYGDWPGFLEEWLEWLIDDLWLCQWRRILEDSGNLFLSQTSPAYQYARSVLQHPFVVQMDKTRHIIVTGRLHFKTPSELKLLKTKSEDDRLHFIGE